MAQVCVEVCEVLDLDVSDKTTEAISCAGRGRRPHPYSNNQLSLPRACITEAPDVSVESSQLAYLCLMSHTKEGYVRTIDHG